MGQRVNINFVFFPLLLNHHTTNEALNFHDCEVRPPIRDDLEASCDWIFTEMIFHRDFCLTSDLRVSLCLVSPRLFCTSSLPKTKRNCKVTRSQVRKETTRIILTPGAAGYWIPSKSSPISLSRWRPADALRALRESPPDRLRPWSKAYNKKQIPTNASQTTKAIFTWASRIGIASSFVTIPAIFRSSSSISFAFCAHISSRAVIVSCVSSSCCRRNSISDSAWSSPNNYLHYLGRGGIR